MKAAGVTAGAQILYTSTALLQVNNNNNSDLFWAGNRLTGRPVVTIRNLLHALQKSIRTHTFRP